MALRFTDGFDSYAATSDLFKKWSQAGTAWSWSSSAGVTGGGGLVASNTNNSIFSSNNGILNTTSVALAFRIKSTGTVTSTSATTFLSLLNSTPSSLAVIAFNSTGIISYTNGNGTVTAAGSSNICDGNWHWIEMKLGGTGADFVGVQIYVDGVLDINSTTTNIVTAGTFDRFQFASSSKCGFVIDDIMIYDNVGNAPVFANFPLGPQVIKTIRPTSDGTCTFGTVSSGTNHSAMVDEVAGDTTDYVEDGTSGHQDLYNYGSVGSPTSIVGAMLNSFMHNPGAGAMSAKGVCKSGATTSVGTSTAIGAGPKTYQQEFGVDPNTSAAWTAANINSAQFGAKVA